MHREHATIELRQQESKGSYLSQTAVLCKSPVGHYKSSNYKEDITSNRLCGNIEAQPLINLCCVICTSHNIEQKPAWNLVPSASIRATQIAE